MIFFILHYRGKDELTIVEKMSGNATAQTVQNASGNGRVITMSDSGDVLVNAVQLGHEAYRDGVVTDHSSQQAETINAVLAHSAMAERMTQYNNKLTGSLALEAALYKAGRTDLLAALADSMYDSSADYWKLMSDGTLVQDEDGWLKDENIIKDKDGNKIGADGQETGLLNILFAKQADGSYKNPGKKYDEFSPLEKIISAQIMEKSGISHYYKDEEKTGICDRSWNLDGKALDMNLVMGYAGDSVATAVFMNYFDNMTNSMIDGNTSIASVVSGYKDSGYLNRLIGYYSAKNEFYNGSHNLFSAEDLARLRISGEFGPDDNYSDKQHKGGDFASKTDDETITGTRLINFKTEDIKTYAFYSGKVTGEKLNDSSSGYSILIEHGFNFEGSFYDTGVTSQYMHLKNESPLKVEDFVHPNTYVGTIGGTGYGKADYYAEHLHYQLMGNLGGLGNNDGDDDIRWNMLQSRRDYFLNQLGITSTANYSTSPTSTQNYYVTYGLNSNNERVNYYNYYYNLNPIWKRMGLKSY